MPSDPNPPIDDHDELAAVRQYVIESGVAPERVAGIDTGVGLRDALLEHRLSGDAPRRTAAQVAASVGITEDDLIELWTAVGLPAPTPGETMLSADDEQVLVAFVAAREVFGHEPVVRFARVFGGAVGRIAEAAFTLFTINVEDPIVARGGEELDVTRAADRSLSVMGVLPGMFQALLRRHALDTIRRLNSAHGGMESHAQLELTVGFADLVGSTEWVRDQDPETLAHSIGRFDELALASLRGPGRIVKSIGDEIMFVTNDPADGCRTALALLEAVTADPVLPTLRVGVASGLMSAIDGDYYGNEVNRAARLVATAAPGEVVVSDVVSALARRAPDLVFHELPPVAVEGLGTVRRAAVTAAVP
jgi:adenylate cyclase